MPLPFCDVQALIANHDNSKNRSKEKDQDSIVIIVTIDVINNIINNIIDNITDNITDTFAVIKELARVIAFVFFFGFRKGKTEIPIKSKKLKQKKISYLGSIGIELSLLRIAASTAIPDINYTILES